MKKIISLSLIVVLTVSLLAFAGCPANKGFVQEQKQIENTIQTSYKLVAVHYIDNTIRFTNVLNKVAEIEITLTYNNSASEKDVVTVPAGETFQKTYSGGYSIATFTIKILSLT